MIDGIYTYLNSEGIQYDPSETVINNLKTNKKIIKNEK
jgi:hypothetical protein